MRNRHSTEPPPGWEALNSREIMEIAGGQPTRETGFWYDFAFALNMMLYTPMPGWILY